MLTTVKRVLKDESGATAIEYGLIAALVSVAAIATLRTMGGSLDSIFGVVDTELTNAANSAGTSGGTGGGSGSGTGT